MENFQHDFCRDSTKTIIFPFHVCLAFDLKYIHVFFYYSEAISSCFLCCPNEHLT